METYLKLKGIIYISIQFDEDVTAFQNNLKNGLPSIIIILRFFSESN